MLDSPIGFAHNIQAPQQPTAALRQSLVVRPGASQVQGYPGQVYGGAPRFTPAQFGAQQVQPQFQPQQQWAPQAQQQFAPQPQQQWAPQPQQQFAPQPQFTPYNLQGGFGAQAQTQFHQY